MPSYLLRNLDPRLWTRFKARAKDEGIHMRTLLLLLVEAYTEGKVSVAMKRTK